MTLVDTARFQADFGLSGERRERPAAPGFKTWTGGQITELGAYLGIPIDVYHSGTLCGGNEVSSTGLKLLSADKGKRSKGKTPRHYWERYRKPNRRLVDTDALRMGRYFHDALLQPELVADLYHRTPEGYDRRQKVFADDKAAEEAARGDGLCIVSHAEAEMTAAMVEAARGDPLFAALLGKGEAEVTLAWQDKETGVWCRARPDFMLANRAFALNVKTDLDASYDGFSASIGKYGYAQSAALELDGYEAVFGQAPTTFLHPVVEKPAKASWQAGDFIATAVWQLPSEDIDRGRWLNRRALRVLADCLSADRWPGYTPEPELCGMPGWLRHVIDEGGQGDPHDDAVLMGDE